MSLRARAALLVAIALLPGMAVIAVSGSQVQDLARRRAAAEVTAVAELTAERLSSRLTDVRRMLTTLPQDGEGPEIAGGERACGRELQRLLAANRMLAVFGWADSSGQLRCFAGDVGRDASVADAEWFRRALSGVEGVVHALSLRPNPGSPPMLVIAQRVETRVGGEPAVAFAGLANSWLGTVAGGARNLPAQPIIAIFDREGTILARSEDAEAWRGRRFPDAPLVQIAGRGEFWSGEIAGFDGVNRVQTLAHVDGMPNLIVTAGIPVEAATREARQLARRQLVGMFVVALAAALIGWVGGDQLVAGPIAAMGGALRRLAAGDLQARAALPTASGEIGELARAFDAMAARLEEGDAQRARAIATLEHRNRQQALVVQVGTLALTATDLVSFARSVTGLLVEAGEAAVCGVNELEADGETVHAVATAGSRLTDEMISTIRLRVGDGSVSARTIESRKSVIVNDILGDAGLTIAPPIESDEPRSLISVPIVLDSRILGNLVLFRRILFAFAAEDVDFAEAVANVLAHTIQRLRIDDQFAMVLEHVPIAVWTTDTHLVLTFHTAEGASRRWTSGHVPRVGDRLIDIPIESGARDALVAMHERALAGQEVHEKLAWFGRTYSCSVAPVRGVTNEVTGTHGAALDVTVQEERQRQNDRLTAELHHREALARLGTLVAGVAHELRNPLFGLSATLDALDARFGDLPDFARYREAMQAEIRRLRGLIGDLMDFGRAPPRDLEDLSFDDVVTEALQSCEAMAKGAGIVVRRLDVGGASLRVQGDRGRLVLALRNLIENAIQQSPAGGEVTLRVEPCVDPEGSWVRCRVLDRGGGFPDADLSRVFDPFFSRRRGGTGLGLAIVQRVVADHRGHVVARNRAAGGAEVEVLLPRAA